MFLRSSALVILAVTIAVAAAANTEQEQQMVNLINEIDQQDSFPLFGGLSVERVENGRSFDGGNDGDADEDLAERAVRYLSSHSVKFNFPEEESEEGRQMEGENRL